MRRSTRLLVSSFLALAATTCNTVISFADDQSTAEAQKVFKQFVELEHAYDPAQADLYAPNAVIKDLRIYSDGQSKTLTWSGDNYKQIIKAKLPVEKARGEQNVYSQVTYNHEGNNVRIKCTRLSPQKRYSAPLELLVAPNGKTGWRIIEESSQSQP